jgi:hypothetical protein
MAGDEGRVAPPEDRSRGRGLAPPPCSEQQRQERRPDGREQDGGVAVSLQTTRRVVISRMLATGLTHPRGGPVVHRDLRQSARVARNLVRESQDTVAEQQRHDKERREETTGARPRQRARASSEGQDKPFRFDERKHGSEYSPRPHESAAWFRPRKPGSGFALFCYGSTGATGTSDGGISFPFSSTKGS